MATKPKAPVDEEAHFRIDDLMRSHGDMKKGMEGMPQALMALMGAEIDKRVASAIEKYKRGDKQEDQKFYTDMIERYEKREDESAPLLKALSDVVANLKVLSEVAANLKSVNAPKKRTGKVKLPSGGTVEMQITEH